MQCACAILSSVARLALKYFSNIISYMARFSRKTKVTERKMCVLIFSTNSSETFLIPITVEQDMIKNVY